MHQIWYLQALGVSQTWILQPDVKIEPRNNVSGADLHKSHNILENVWGQNTFVKIKGAIMTITLPVFYIVGTF